MKNLFKYILLLPAAAMTFSACNWDSEEDFDNKGFIDETTMTNETIIKGDVDVVKSFTVATARPAEKEINISVQVETGLVDRYNVSYYSEAELLPDSCYNLLTSSVKINEGSVKSDDVSIEFYKLSNLDRDKSFVLPVSISTPDIELISSATVYYYTFRAGALINVVADMSRNWCEVTWATPDLVTDMHQITMEALIYPREFGKLISTVMGIEGVFLMRIGDAGYPDNQIQIATSRGNFPDADSNKGLLTNTWQHVALTYDSDTQEYVIYVNGQVQSRGTKDVGTVTIVGNGSDRNFLIGKSYDDNRWLEGNISEVRVWNVVRTQEEIASSIYTVDPQTEGLVGYWKFDDETSSYVVKDATGHGNDAKANSALVWHSVSLPE